MKKFCVSLTTIPSRIHNLEKTIFSLKKQTIKPDKIFLNIPHNFIRFPNDKIEEKKIKEFRDLDIEIIRCDDYGPSTKILGSVDKTKSFDCVIILDDDHIYDNKMFEIFLEAYEKKRGNYSFYVQKVFSLYMGQGADGILIDVEKLRDIKKFYNKFVFDNTNLFLNDDLWISMYLQFVKHSPIQDLSKKLIEKINKELIYEIHISKNSLKEELGKNFFNRRKIAKLEIIKFKFKNYFNKFSQ